RRRNDATCCQPTYSASARSATAISTPMTTSDQFTGCPSFGASLLPLQPDAQHTSYLLHRLGGAVLPHVRQQMPVWIVEVDDVDGRDARLVQRDVVVFHRHLAEFVLAEGGTLQLRGDVPHLVDQFARLERRVLLHRETSRLAGDHVEQDGRLVGHLPPLL